MAIPSFQTIDTAVIQNANGSVDSVISVQTSANCNVASSHESSQVYIQMLTLANYKQRRSTNSTTELVRGRHYLPVAHKRYRVFCILLMHLQHCKRTSVGTGLLKQWVQTNRKAYELLTRLKQEYSCLLRCNAVKFGRHEPTFRRNVQQGRRTIRHNSGRHVT
jgi:hypothetical protein